MTYELTPQDTERMKRILAELIEQCEADACLVCDQAGHVLACQDLRDQDPLLISALGAGVFVATKELARILGEEEFSSVLHQGVNRSILIGAITEEALIIILFSGDDKVGLVKLYAPAAAGALRSVFTDVTARGTTNEVPDRHFVLKETGAIFGNISTVQK